MAHPSGVPAPLATFMSYSLAEDDIVRGRKAVEVARYLVFSKETHFIRASNITGQLDTLDGHFFSCFL